MSRYFGYARRGYALLEEGMGMVLPLLAVASTVPDLVSFRTVAVVALWLGCGHTVLFYLGLYPALQYRPFYRGLFAFGAGICWPLWILSRQRS